VNGLMALLQKNPAIPWHMCLRGAMPAGAHLPWQIPCTWPYLSLSPSPQVPFWLTRFVTPHGSLASAIGRVA
jgi:hypothetical protein